MLYQNAAALSGLIVWYGMLVLLAAPGRMRWLWPLAPLAAGWCSHRALGWYLGAVHPALLPLLQQFSGGRTLQLFIQDVGLREELIKLLFALPCMLRLPPRRAPTTAAFVGLGFVAAENRWLFAGHAEPALLVGRVFSTTTLHMATTALCGAALMAARSRTRPWSWFWTVFFCIVITRGLYDWAPAVTWTSWLSQGVVIALMAVFFRTCHQLSPASPKQLRSALLWFILGTAIQHSLSLAITCHRWDTSEAAWAYAHAFILSVPAAVSTALLMITFSPSKSRT